MRLSLRVAGKTFLFNFQVLFEPGARGRGGAEVLQAAGDHTLEERRTSAKATFGQQVEQLLFSFVLEISICSLYQQQHALARHEAGDQPTEGVGNPQLKLVILGPI